MARHVVAAVVLALGLARGAGGDDDCDGVMRQLAAAQRDAQAQMDVVDALESAIGAPDWDASRDGWMLDALDAADHDLVGALNTAAVFEEQAHAAHCY
jgi:hypothetical protein